MANVAIHKRLEGMEKSLKALAALDGGGDTSPGYGALLKPFAERVMKTKLSELGGGAGERVERKYVSVEEFKRELANCKQEADLEMFARDTVLVKGDNDDWVLLPWASYAATEFFTPVILKWFGSRPVAEELLLKGTRLVSLDEGLSVRGALGRLGKSEVERGTFVANENRYVATAHEIFLAGVMSQMSKLAS